MRRSAPLVWAAAILLILFSQDATASEAKGSLTQEEEAAASAQSEMLKFYPLASRTEDALIMAGGTLQRKKTKLADEQAREHRLSTELEKTDNQLQDSSEHREHATLKVSDEQDALKRATALVNQAREEEDKELKFRSLSEQEQAEGIAVQKPSGVLLADSKKLNRQSNMVLGKAHSTQAKALAALDLKMAESLANRASDGMKAAKGFFSQAIDDRKRATAEANGAAKNMIRAASVSLAENRGDPELLRIMHADETGPKALQDIVAADAKHVDEAETALGQAQQTLSTDRVKSGELGVKINQVQDEINRLHHQLRTAQAEVLAAAKAHVEATQRLRKATATNLAAETKVDKMRAHDMEIMKKELNDAQDSQLHASSRYEQASAKMEGINQRRTKLQVRVARLKLELKKAKLERDQALQKSAKSSHRAEQARAKMKSEVAKYKQARLQLAEHGLLQHQASNDRKERIGSRGRDSNRESFHSEMKKQDESMISQAEEAESAKQEAQSVQKAQEEVQRQLARVNQLEASLHN